MTTMVFEVPVLSDSDERELAITIEAGVFARSVLDGAATPPSGVTRTELDLIWQAGEAAYDRFVQANLRLVAMVTRRAARVGVDTDDLFQEGVVGLLEAVRRYDHTRGARFATFALPWIRMRIGECSVTRGGTIGLPASRAKAWVQVTCARDALGASLGRRAADDEVARAVGRPVAQVRDLLRYTPAAHTGDPGAWAEVRASPANTADRLGVQRLLHALSREERGVLVALYGLGDGPALSYDEVALRLDVSSSTVRRRERAALDRLRYSSAEDAA
jgi:RNA polymerase sigma factor (sigma-70 family)